MEFGGLRLVLPVGLVCGITAAALHAWSPTWVQAAIAVGTQAALMVALLTKKGS